MSSDLGRTSSNEFRRFENAKAVKDVAADEAGKQGKLDALLSYITSMKFFAVFALYVVTKALGRVMYKRVLSSLPTEYSGMLVGVYWPISTQVITTLAIGLCMAYMRRQGHAQYTWRFLLPGNPDAASKAMPLYKFALLALGDSLSTVLQAPSTMYISQTIQSLLSMTLIVFTAALAFVVLGTRFKQVHVIGGLLIILAVLVDFSPEFSNSDCSEKGLADGLCLLSYKSEAGNYVHLSTGATFLWYGLFLVGILPQAAGNVCKEVALQGNNVSLIYATWWVGNFTAMWSLLSLPMSWLIPGKSVAPSDTLEVFLNTGSCMLGQVSVPGLDDVCAASSMPLIWYSVDLVLNPLSAFLFLWMTKHMSSIWATLASVLSLDFTTIFGSISVIAGGTAEVMNLTDWLATALVSVGIWVYRLEPEVKRVIAQENEKSQEKDVTDEDAVVDVEAGQA